MKHTFSIDRRESAATRRFVSSLGPQLEAYLKLMRAVGRRYDRVEAILRHLDRFIANESDQALITRDLLGRWLASTPHLAPGTLRAHASAARQFCRYLARTEPRTWIPDRSLYPDRIPKFRPHMFSTNEVGDLISAAALRMPTQNWPLARQTYRALLLVLYGTGLRIGEALRLRIRDVDLEARIFFISETKFFKSRWVPFSASLAEQLHAYLIARTATAPVGGPDDAFFVNSRRKPCGYSQVARTFQLLIKEAGIDTSASLRGRVRLHDLRHAFAVHCVLRWYREGADVQSKLPLLATYLGHGTIIATHVYLRSTAELLQEASGRFEQAYGSLVVASAEEITHVS